MSSSAAAFSCRLAQPQSRETHNSQVTLFERYREREDRPFAVFVCRLRGRAGKALPPPVASAAVHIRLHLGPLRRMLYWVGLRGEWRAP